MKLFWTRTSSPQSHVHTTSIKSLASLLTTGRLFPREPVNFVHRKWTVSQEISQNISKVLTNCQAQLQLQLQLQLKLSLALFSFNPSYMWLLASNMWLLATNMWLLASNMWLLASTRKSTKKVLFEGLNNRSAQFQHLNDF